MFKFLPGILFIQLVSCGLFFMIAQGVYDLQFIILIVAIGGLCSILTAFWFSSIAKNMYIDDQSIVMERHAEDRESMMKASEREKADLYKEKSELKDQHAREREKILIEAERDKAKTVAESYQKITQESNKAHAKANFKVGAVFAAAIGAGGIMIFSQLVTVGAMVLVASGSGLSGYILRARHERVSRKKQITMNEKSRLSGPSVVSLLQHEKP